MPRINQDGFDMGILQKHLRRQQRASLNAQNTVTRLSPAEIRELNNAVIAQKNASTASFNRTASLSRAYSQSSRTPPLSPDNASAKQMLMAQQRYGQLPTPPISPDQEQREFPFGRQPYSPGQTSRPQSSAHSGHTSSGPSRRPSNASSYRGVTHKGPDSPRSGSLSMVQDSAQQIVSNPLSNFSRPRISTKRASPDRYDAEKRHGRVMSPSMDDEPMRSIERDTPSPERRTSPGPVEQDRDSFGYPERDENERVGREPLQPPALRIRKQRSRSMPALIRSRSPSLADTPIRIVDMPSGGDDMAVNYTALPQGLEGIPLQKQIVSEANWKRLQDARQKRTWRKTFNNSATDRGRSSSALAERKLTFGSNQSSTSLISVNYADTVAGEAPLMKDSLKPLLPSNKNSVFRKEEKAEEIKGDFGQHPAVRPHSRQSDVRSVVSLPVNVLRGTPREEEKDDNDDEVDDKNEEEEVVKEHQTFYPTYTRCSCCGKLRKPAGFTSNLTPVLENEHLRTNLTFELVRSATDAGRYRSTSGGVSNRAKHIPILPMEIGNQMRQAMIEPIRSTTIIEESAVNDEEQESEYDSTESPSIGTPREIPSRAGSRLNGEIIAPSKPQVMMARSREEPKVVRFANTFQRRKEIERRGREREQKGRAGQGHMYSMSQLDSLYSDAEEPDQTFGKAETVRVEQARPMRVIRSKPSLRGETDIIDQMPKPPSTDHAKAVSTSVSEPTTSTATQNVQAESAKPEDEILPTVDLSSMDGSAYPLNAVSLEDTPVPVSHTQEAVSEDPASENLQNSNEYDEIASSSPFSEEVEARTPTQASFFRNGNQDANSSDEALPLPPPSSKDGKSTTIVRIVRTPSIPLPQRSPKRPQTASSNTGPAKLGDWVLPVNSAPQQDPRVYQPYRNYAAMKFDGMVSTNDIPTPLSASSSRNSSVVADILDPSLNSSSFSFFQVHEVTHTPVTQVVTSGNGRVKEVGSNIAKRMREAQRRVGVPV